MHCFDCMTATPDIAATIVPSFRAKPVVALCAYCGTAVCHHHARSTCADPRRIGLVPQTAPGVRRILCTRCAGTATTAGTRRPRIAATTR